MANKDVLLKRVGIEKNKELLEEIKNEEGKLVKILVLIESSIERIIERTQEEIENRMNGEERTRVIVDALDIAIRHTKNEIFLKENLKSFVDYLRHSDSDLEKENDPNFLLAKTGWKW